jgi:uncharacterized lipoprotein
MVWDKALVGALAVLVIAGCGARPDELQHSSAADGTENAIPG